MKILVLAIFSFSILWATSCAAKVARKNVVVMIDYSGTIKPETLDNYARTISSDVFMSLSYNDRFVLTPIDEGSKVQSVQLEAFDLSKQGFDKNVGGVTHREEKIRQNANAFKAEKKEGIYRTVHDQKEQRKQFTNLTDILSALEQVSSNLEKNREPSTLRDVGYGVTGETELVSHNVVILFSDMIHESSDLNFLKVKLEMADSDRILNDLRSKGRIPDLSGTEVFVCGRTGKNNAFVDNVRYFWTNYFSFAKANLRMYEFDCSKRIVDALARVPTETVN